MNKRTVFGFIIVIVFVLIASFFATNSFYGGSVFDNTQLTGSFKGPTKVPTNKKKTPTDFVIQKFTVYQAPELMASAVGSDPYQDTELNEGGVNEGNASSTTSSNKNNEHQVRVIVKNLGTTIAPLPETKVTLNGTIISDISGLVSFSKVTKEGMELFITIDASADYVNEQGQNSLEVHLDPENKITEASKENNIVSVKF